MADLTEPTDDLPISACCAPQLQADCCDSSEKAECCSPESASCSCSA